MKVRICTLILTLFLSLSSAFPAFSQGSWMPANADYSRPRTLFKLAELPAIRAYIATPEIYPIYQTLYNQTQSFSPGNMMVNGHRRNAAHAAKNSAFILLVDRKPVGGMLDTLTTSELDLFRNKSISLLNIINTMVEAYPDINNYLWRSNEITDNSIAYDLLKGAGVADTTLAQAKSLIQEFAGNLHEEVSFNLFNLGLFGLHVDNHALRTAASLGLAAIAINDATSGSSNDQPQSWINTAMYNIDNVLWQDSDRQSEPGILGGYSEGPHYLRFGMKHVLPFIHSMGNFLPDASASYSFDGNTRTIRNPWFDPSYALLFEWAMKIRYPDGTLPALEDCNVMVGYPEAAIMENPALVASIDYSSFHPGQPGTLWKQLHYSSDDVVADYISARTQPAPLAYPLFMPLAESGNLLFRSGWDSLATYLHFTAKNGRARDAGKGHNQADVSSFVLHAHGQLMALDAGYLKWDRRDEVSNAQNHSMILVDSAGPVNGSTTNGGDADGFIEHDFDLTHLDYAEVRTAYVGASIVRKPMFVRQKYFVLGDFCSSAQTPQFRWQLHGYGLENGDSTHGNFVLDATAGRGTYTRNGVSLLAQVTASGGVDLLHAQTNIHELRYDSMQQHSTLLADKVGSNAAFLAALMPYVSDTPQVEMLCAPDCGALHVSQDGFEDYFFTSGLITANVSGLPGDLVSDADLAFVSWDSTGAFAQLLNENGTVLRMGNDTLCSTSVMMDLAFQVLDSANYEGYASEAGTFWLYDLTFAPGSVLGQGVNNWTYDAGANVLMVQMGQGGHYTVHQEVIIGTNVADVDVLLEVWPNPATGDQVRVRTVIGAELRLHDLQGRLLARYRAVDGEAALPLNGLPAGVYVLSTYVDGQWRKGVRIVKQ